MIRILSPGVILSDILSADPLFTVSSHGRHFSQWQLTTGRRYSVAALPVVCLKSKIH